MSDQNNNDSSSNNNSSRPGSGFRPSNAATRIGRIGQWGGSSSSTPSNSRSGSGARIATFRDLNASSGATTPQSHAGHGHSQGNAGSDGNDDEEEESGGEGQDWFTGGERSGLAVQNPNHRQNIPGGDLVRGLLKKVAEAGPPKTTAREEAEPRKAFSGSGNTLGSDEVASQVVPDPNARPEQAETEESAVRHLTFWRNGFSIQDGPLMSYDNPENNETLRLIDQGQAPPSVLNVRYGQPVDLMVARRINEDYIPPPPRPLQAFEGSGNRLGAPTPVITGTASSTTGPVASGSGQDRAPPAAGGDPQSLQTKFEVDQSQPTTSIQLRLADGTRMVCRMNLTHTIRDIRNFINASRPENLTRAYTIATTFPNRILEDDMQTIEAAGLKNSVVVQRWA